MFDLLVLVVFFLSEWASWLHRCRTPDSTTSMVVQIITAIERYRADEGQYPGASITDPRGAFPAVLEALIGRPPPDGLGGRSAPYLDKFRSMDIGVRDGDAFRPAEPWERDDPLVEKYLLDRWGQPFWYRENRSKPAAPWQRNPRSFDIWSCGPDGINQTLLGVERSDDVGNW